MTYLGHVHSSSMMNCWRLFKLAKYFHRVASVYAHIREGMKDIVLLDWV